jgi:hypothetical protein
MKVFGLILFLLFSHNLISACTCARLDEKQSIESLKKTDAVFQGEVISISPPQTRKLKNSKGKIYYEEQYLNVEFKVLRAWKGVESETVIVESETDNWSCSLRYKVGQTDYVAANGKPLKTNICGRAVIAPDRLAEIFGAEKVFESPTPEQSTRQTEPAQSFLSKIYNKIIYLFS